MKNFEHSVLFITAGGFDKDDTEQLEVHDRIVLVSSVSSLCESENFINFDSVLFLSENNCSSLVSAHLMAEILEEKYNKHIRYILLPYHAWSDTLKSIESIRTKEPFEEQLWVVVGSPKWMSKAVRALLPPKEETPELKELVSGCVVCGYTYKQEELLWLYGYNLITIPTSTELN